jgi:hypothetical protein
MTYRSLVSIALLALLSACAGPEPLPLPPKPMPEPVVMAPPPQTTLTAAPKRLRAALARAAPREAALVAAPDADAESIALVRKLDQNVRNALADLERDGGRHVTPTAVARARTAVGDLENHLNEFQAARHPEVVPAQPLGIPKDQPP